MNKHKIEHVQQPLATSHRVITWLHCAVLKMAQYLHWELLITVRVPGELIRSLKVAALDKSNHVCNPYISVNSNLSAHYAISAHLANLLLLRYISFPYIPQACGMYLVHRGHGPTRCTSEPRVVSPHHPETLVSGTALPTWCPCSWGQRSVRWRLCPDDVHRGQWQWHVSVLHIQIHKWKFRIFNE